MTHKASILEAVEGFKLHFISVHIESLDDWKKKKKKINIQRECCLYAIITQLSIVPAITLT